MVRDDDEFAVRAIEGVIQVAGLGVLVGGARDIRDAKFRANRLELRGSSPSGFRFGGVLIVAALFGPAQNF